jgi:putative alpha-1,2-mannosidase
LRVGSGEFRVVARNLSRENKYVKSVKLNGRPVTDWKIRHADIMRGGELVFEMESCRITE